MYSLLWSEHCAYKHSAKLLRTLPTEGEHVVHGAGRERRRGRRRRRPGLRLQGRVPQPPERGRAVPGRRHRRRRHPARHLRDRRAPDRGARLAALRRASAETARDAARYLLDGAVSGIGHYGNSIGVPTVGGEVYFEAPLRAELPGQRDGARAGAARASSCAARRRGAGNLLVLFGAATGRDGIGGASVLASAELGARAARRTSARRCRSATRSRRRSCSSARSSCSQRGLLVSLQDLGAAGLTSSAAEMASKGEVGIDIDVARVPLREPGMAAVRGDGQRVPGAHAVRGRAARRRRRCSSCARSGRCGGAAIGTVTDSGAHARACDGERCSATCRCARWSTTARCMTSQPSRPPRRCTRPPRRRCAAAARRRPRLCSRCSPRPTSASRRPLFEHYDAIVQSRTVRRPAQADAAVLALPDGGALAVSIDCNGRRVAADPYRGTVAAVLECAANLACVGRRAARHDQQPQLRQPREAARRLAADRSRCAGSATPAARWRAPIVGGNVSLYNEGPAGPIYPTPVIGMVGRLPDARRAGRLGFAAAGDADRAVAGPFAPVAGRQRARQAARRAAARRARRRSTSRPSLAAQRGGARGGARRRSVERPRHRRGRPGGRAGGVLPGGRHRRERRAVELADGSAQELFGECSGGFLLSGAGRGARALGERVPRARARRRRGRRAVDHGRRRTDRIRRYARRARRRPMRAAWSATLALIACECEHDA